MKRLFFAAAMAGFAMASSGVASAQVTQLTDVGGDWRKMKPAPSGNVWLLRVYEDPYEAGSWRPFHPGLSKDRANVHKYIMAWADARTVCAGAHDGVRGWRLPTLEEVKAEAFEDGEKFWTSTPNEFAIRNLGRSEALPGGVAPADMNHPPFTACVHAAYTPGKVPVAQVKSEKKAPDSKPSSGAVLTATKQPEAKPLPKASAEMKAPPVAPTDPAPKTKKRIAKWNEQVLEVGKTEAEARAKVEAGRTRVIAEKTKNAPIWRVGSETPITCGPHQGQGTVFSCRKTITFNYEEEYYPGAKAPGGSAKTISR